MDENKPPPTPYSPPPTPYSPLTSLLHPWSSTLFLLSAIGSADRLRLRRDTRALRNGATAGLTRPARPIVEPRAPRLLTALPVQPEAPS